MSLPNGYTEIAGGKIAAITTSLEMLTRPRLRPQAPGPEPALRRVEQPEPAWYRDLFRRIGEPYLWYSRLQLTDAALAAIIRHPSVEISALASAGRDEGLLELDFREPETCELAFFGVTSELIGTGAGRWLMNRAIERAWARPIRRFWVHTCTLDHPDALAFYIRSGFKPYKRQVEVADDPRLKGLLAASAAPHVPIIA